MRDRGSLHGEPEGRRTVLSRIAVVLQRFARDRNGNVLVLTGLAVPVMIALAAGTIETRLVTGVKLRMQNAADQAVIAALAVPFKRGEKDFGRLRRARKADRLFEVNFPNDRLVSNRSTGLTTWIERDRMMAIYRVAVSYESSFGRISPFEGTRIALEATAEWLPGQPPRLTGKPLAGRSRK